MSFNRLKYGIFNQHAVVAPSGYYAYGWGANSYYQSGQNGYTTQVQTPTKFNNQKVWIGAGMCGDTSILIKNDNTLWTIGRANTYQTGLNNTNNVTSLTQIGSDTDWSRVEGGNGHFLALKNNGTLWSWGLNGNGQCGQNSTSNIQVPTQIGSASNWTSITCGYSHSAAMNSSGEIYTWGLGSQYSTGQNTLSDIKVPTKLGVATDWKSVSSGVYNCIAIKTNGEMWGWGYAGSYALNMNTTTNQPVPIKLNNDTWITGIAYHLNSMGVKSDGKLYSTGYGTMGGCNDSSDTPTFTQCGSETDWNSASLIYGSGYWFGGAVKNNKLYGWGVNTNYQIGDGTTNAKATPTQLGSDSDWISTFMCGGGIHRIALKNT